VRFFKIVYEQILIQKNFCSPTYQRIWNLKPRSPCLYGYDKVWTIEFLGSFSSLVAGSLYRRFDSEWNGFSFDYFAASYSETIINMNAEKEKITDSLRILLHEGRLIFVLDCAGQHRPKV